MPSEHSPRTEQSCDVELAEHIQSQIYEHAEEIQQRKLAEVFNRLQSTGGGVILEDQEIIERFSQRLVDRLLQAPAQSLREAAQSVGAETITIFQVDELDELREVVERKITTNVRVPDSTPSE